MIPEKPINHPLMLNPESLRRSPTQPQHYLTLLLFYLKILAPQSLLYPPLVRSISLFSSVIAFLIHLGVID